jgi:hypothetical protein
MSTRLFTFTAVAQGPWEVTDQTALAGPPLARASHVQLQAGAPAAPAGLWSLRGITSNERYVERDEKAALVAQQPSLGEPARSCAALIPIRKTAAWWALSQDQRRHVLEDQSRHIRTGLRYLPAVARRLHHCRDLSENEPFDFITWFEYAPQDNGLFDRLLAELRASPEWAYVDREVDIRLSRIG